MSRMILKEIRGLVFHRNQEITEEIREFKNELKKDMNETREMFQLLSGKHDELSQKMTCMSQQMDDISEKMVRMSKQMESSSHTCGLNVEACAKSRIAELSSVGCVPFNYFSSPKSRQSMMWNDIYAMIHYLGLKKDEVVVMKRLCSMLKVKHVKLFLKKLPATLQSALTFKAKEDLERIDSENFSLQLILQGLQKFKHEYKENELLLVQKLLEPVVKFLGSVRSSITNKEIRQLSMAAGHREKAGFLFMYLVWLVSGEVCFSLEIDVIGMCRRSTIADKIIYHICMGKIKSSMEQIGDAKRQLTLTQNVMKIILSKTSREGADFEVTFDPVIMVYKTHIGPYRFVDGFHIVSGFWD